MKEAVRTAPTNAASRPEDGLNSVRSKKEILVVYSERNGFIRECGELRSGLIKVLDSLNEILNSRERLRNSAMDFRRLDFIIRNMESMKGDTRQLIEMLKQHIQFFARYDKALSDLLQNYSSSGDERNQLSAQILSLGGDWRKIALNIGRIEEIAGRIKDTLVKSKVMAIIKLMKNYIEEASVLSFDLQDLRNWNIHFHEDIRFFTATIEEYFAGTKPEEKRQFKSLDKFKDEKLKKAVLENNNVRELYRVAGITHQDQRQIAFIESLIKFIQSDLDGNEWKRNTATKKFYESLASHAKIFSEQFRNEEFAKIILKNKSIGEQPFLWIDELEKMKKIIEDEISRKSTAIENAKNSIITIFEARIEILKNAVISLSKRLDELLKSAFGEDRILGEVREGLKRIERTLYALWEKRKAKFMPLKKSIEVRDFSLGGETSKLTENFGIIEEALKVLGNDEYFQRYLASSNTTIGKMGKVPNANNFGMLIRLAKIAASMEAILVSSVKYQENINRKIDSFLNYDMDKLRESIRTLFEDYKKIVFFAQLVETGNDTAALQKMLEEFMRKHYG